jgi:hypothetical protein
MINELVKLLLEQLEDMRAQVADLRQDRDHWREAFEATQRRLPSTSATGLLRSRKLTLPVRRCGCPAGRR